MFFRENHCCCEVGRPSQSIRSYIKLRRAGDASKSYIKTVTKTGSSTFDVDGKSNWAGIEVFKKGATISIIQTTTRKGVSSYKVDIKGLTGFAIRVNVPALSYVNGNTTIVYKDNKFFTVK